MSEGWRARRGARARRGRHSWRARRTPPAGTGRRGGEGESRARRRAGARRGGRRGAAGGRARARPSWCRARARAAAEKKALGKAISGGAVAAALRAARCALLAGGGEDDGGGGATREEDRVLRDRVFPTCPPTPRCAARAARAGGGPVRVFRALRFCLQWRSRRRRGGGRRAERGAVDLGPRDGAARAVLQARCVRRPARPRLARRCQLHSCAWSRLGVRSGALLRQPELWATS